VSYDEKSTTRDDEREIIEIDISREVDKSTVSETPSWWPQAKVGREIFAPNHFATIFVIMFC